MGLADRDYMRNDGRGWHWSATVVLMAVIVAAFLAQWATFNYVAHHDDPKIERVLEHLALVPADLKHGYAWELLTFQFLHAGWWHLFGNLLGIWFFGRFIEERLGRANMLLIYFAGGIAGGLLQSVLGLAFSNVFGGAVVGASAGVFALFAAFAMMEPFAQVLLWFLLPVRAQYLLWASLAISLACVVWFHGTGVAHAAHLGGLLAGMAFIHWQLYSRRPHLPWRPLESRQRKRELVRAASVHASLWRQTPDPDPELPPAEFISREVDPILDKISAHGLQSLTDSERKTLEAARKKMERR